MRASSAPRTGQLLQLAGRAAVFWVLRVMACSLGCYASMRESILRSPRWPLPTMDVVRGYVAFLDLSAVLASAPVATQLTPLEFWKLHVGLDTRCFTQLLAKNSELCSSGRSFRPERNLGCLNCVHEFSPSRVGGGTLTRRQKGSVHVRLHHLASFDLRPSSLSSVSAVCTWS